MGIMRRVLRTGAAGGICLLLSACGSQLTPTEVVAAQTSDPAPMVAPGLPGLGDGAEQPTSTDDPPAGPAVGESVPTTDVGQSDAPGQSPDRDPQHPTKSGTSGTGQSPSTTREPTTDCSGFHNQTGITDDTITIANASDVAGPVPGLFESAQDAVEAFAAYFNATGGLCGRRLSVLPLDTRTDASADQLAYSQACDHAFAAVGSMAAFDSGGALEAQRCGLPDLRSAIVTGARLACRTCFGAQSGSPDTSADVVPQHYRSTYGADAVRHAGYVWIDAGPARENAEYEMRAWQRSGFSWVYHAAIGVSEFNYVPYAQRLRDAHVQVVRFLGAPDQAVRLARAMTQIGYHPEAVLIDSSAYDDALATDGGSDVDGTDVFVNFTPFEDAHSNPELQLYLRWLEAVKPGARPTFDGLFAWSAARLFADRAAHLGGHLTRASLVSALRHTDDWTDHGLHPPQRVGSKTVGPCWRFLTLRDGHWKAQGGTRFQCGRVTRVR